MGTRNAIKFWFTSRGIFPLGYVDEKRRMENCSERISELCWVSRLMCRCEVHLVKYLVLPPSQLKKTFRGGAHGHIGS